MWRSDGVLAAGCAELARAVNYIFCELMRAPFFSFRGACGVLTVCWRPGVLSWHVLSTTFSVN